MKRIIITEDQAKRLKLISENADPVSQFERYCQLKIQEINKLYNRVTALSVYEILHKEMDMVNIGQVVEKLENDLHMANKQAYDHINNLPENNLDLRIDKAYSLVSDKLSSLLIIILALEKLQLSAEEHNLVSSFKDIKPLDISDIQ